MNILIVDDEVVALRALTKRVDWEKLGFSKVFTASDAKQAKKILSTENIDLLMTDIEMPGESGLSLAQFVREEYPSTECIMITCHADFGFIKQSMKYRVLDYILKPIDYEELNAILESFVEQRRKYKNNLQEVINRVHTNKSNDFNLDLPEDRMQVIKKYIDDHISEKIYIEDLGKIVHLNAQHLMRVFKRETGKSLTEYITERRMLIASSLLKDSDYSINFIADSVGCENYSYFTKLFKKHSGFTPKEYRAQFKVQK